MLRLKRPTRTNYNDPTYTNIIGILLVTPWMQFNLVVWHAWRNFIFTCGEAVGHKTPFLAVSSCPFTHRIIGQGWLNSNGGHETHSGPHIHSGPHTHWGEPIPMGDPRPMVDSIYESYILDPIPSSLYHCLCRRSIEPFPLVFTYGIRS